MTNSYPPKSTPDTKSKSPRRIPTAMPLFAKQLPPKSTHELEYYTGIDKVKGRQENASKSLDSTEESEHEVPPPSTPRVSKPKMAKSIPFNVFFHDKQTPGQQGLDGNCSREDPSGTKLTYPADQECPRFPTDALLESDMVIMVPATQTGRQARMEGLSDEEKGRFADEEKERLEEEANERRLRAVEEEEEKWGDECDREDFRREKKKIRKREAWPRH